LCLAKAFLLHSPYTRLFTSTSIIQISKGAANRSLVLSLSSSKGTESYFPCPHTAVYHVTDLKKSVEFYTKAVGMRATRITETAANLEFDDEGKQPSILLLQANGEIQRGDGFYGFGVHTPAAGVIMASAEAFGGKVLTPLDNYAYGASLIPDEDDLKQFPVRYGKIADPDGYVVEVTEAMRQSGSFAKVIVNVIDLDETISFYEKALGFKLLRKRSNVNSKPKEASQVAYMGASNQESEKDGPFLELVYNYATETLDLGTGFNRLEVSINDEKVAKERITSNGNAIMRDNGDIIETRDPNNYNILLRR